MTGNKWLVTWWFGYYDSGLYLINCSQLSSWIQRQKTAWETHKRKRTENNEEWFFLWIKQSNPLRHRKNTNDTIHMCCKHNGLKMLLWTATFPNHDHKAQLYLTSPMGGESALLITEWCFSNWESFQLGSNATVDGPPVCFRLFKS